MLTEKIGPGWLRALLGWVVEHLVNDPVFADLLRSARPKSISEVYELQAARDRLRKRFKDEVRRPSQWLS